MEPRGHETVTPQQDHADMIPRLYYVVDHRGRPVQDSTGVIEHLEGRRHELRQHLLAAFPEREPVPGVSPASIRNTFAEYGYRTSPVAVITDTPDGHEHLINLFAQYPDITGPEAPDILRDTLDDSYTPLTAYSPDINAIVFLDPTRKIEDSSIDDRSLEQEYSRIILAHELGHSAVNQSQEVSVRLTKRGAIKTQLVVDEFGSYTEPYELEEPFGEYVGSVWSEGSATLLASLTYNSTQYEPERTLDSITHVPTLGRFKIPLFLFSSVEGETVAEAHVGAASIIFDYDRQYPGIIANLQACVRGDITRMQFADFVNSQQAGLFELLLHAEHQSTHIKLLRDLGRIVELETA